MALCSRALYNALLLDIAPYLSLEDKRRALRLNFGECLPIPPDARGRAYAGYALLRSVFKKFQDEVKLEATALPAYTNFIEANNACSEWEPSESNLGPYDEVLIGEFRKSVWNFFTRNGFDLLDVEGIMSKVDFGPGSSPGCTYNDFASKIGTSSLGASNPYLIRLFEAWVSHHPARVDCELARYLQRGAPEVIRSVLLTAVPKTTEIARLVKPEPPLNMFFQKGIQAVMEERLCEHFGIDLSTQPLFNAELARIGSLDGSYGTIDLKQASDYLSHRLCSRFIPQGSLRWLERTRSDLVTLPWCGREITIPLAMMATMGNAWCFPLQTVIFCCVVEAAYRSLGLPFDRIHRTWVRYDDQRHAWETQVEPGSWGVFGDDIVVRRDAYDTVIRLLTYLGFKPNLDKSFNEGRFRESCGSDWLDGFNVRGVYIKTLKTPQSRASAFNRLSAWSSRTGIKLPMTLLVLRAACKDDKAPVVPVWENEDAGVKLPFSLAPSAQVLEDREPAVGPHCKLPVDGPPRERQETIYGARAWVNTPDAVLYKAWQPVQEGYYASDEKGEGYGNVNPFAVYLAFLSGRVRNGFVSYRTRDEFTSYRVVKRVASCWDYMPDWKIREYGSLDAWKGALEPILRK